MRKFLSLFLIIIIAISLVACSNNSETTNMEATPIAKKEYNSEEVALMDLCENYAIEVANGNFENLYSNCSDEIKKSLSMEDLQKTYFGLIKDAGKYIDVMNRDVQSALNYSTISIDLRYKEKGLRLLFSINNSSKVIEGFWINYVSIEIEAESGDGFTERNIQIGQGENKLDGMLTIGKTEKPEYVVILVQGSGQTDMNESISVNKPFKDIATGLAKEDIAVVRYNKRYFQYPDAADSLDITIYDEVLDDVKNAIDFCKNDPDLKNSKIIIAGHSLGGMLVPKIALDNSEVSGIISLAGSPRKLYEIMLTQSKIILDANETLSAKEKADALEETNSIVEQLRKIDNDEIEIDDKEMVGGVCVKYWKSLNNINTSEIIKEIKVPFLVLQGEEDFQVTVEDDFEAWKKVLENYPYNKEFISYPKLNHLFMVTGGKKDVTDYDIKATVDENVINDMAKFIKSI